MCAKVVDKQEKKVLIIEAAIREFIKKGFARTTINDIAKSAGIGKGTVYEYFSTKEEIINYTFQHFVQSMEMDFADTLMAEISPVEKLTKIFEAFAGFIDSHSSDMLELMFDFWSESIKSKGDDRNIIFNEMKKFYRAYGELFADIIVEGMSKGIFRKDINPKYTASAIVGALDGILVQWVLDKENFNYKEVVKSICNTFIKGISA